MVGLDLVVAELGDDLWWRFSPLLGRPAPPPVGCPALGCTSGPGWAGPSWPQHAVLGLGCCPVHGLLHMLLHAEPLVVADGDAAGAPLVVVAALLGVAQRLLGLLVMQTNKQTQHIHYILIYFTYYYSLKIKLF